MKQEGISAAKSPAKDGPLPLIAVEDFHKSYQAKPAVMGLSFEVKPGEILGLVGRNGAGKTTTLRALTGIILPSKGRLCVARHDVVKDPVAAKRHLAYVPDDPRLFDVLTVWEHMQFAAEAYRVASFERTGRELLERFELAERRNTICQELSRGMRQKVAICCALIHNPEVLLLDEPLTGLDPRGIRTIKEIIRERATTGAATVLSSHLLILVEDVCTQYLILHHGRNRFFGTIEEAQSAVGVQQSEVSLEEIYFRLTEGT